MIPWPWVHRSALEKLERELAEAKRVSEEQVDSVIAAIDQAASEIVSAVNAKP
jgi:RNA polymerase-interacting CarD/CdnL/TRCF family regulator